MKKLNIILSILFIYTFISQKTLAQGPPPAEAPSENKILIDKIIKVSRFENYFKTMCMRKIDDASEKNSWTATKRNKIIESINFENFNFTIYNSFALNSKKDLEDIITLLKKINKNNKSDLRTFFISNPMIESNLEGYLENLIEGKYITN